MVITKDENKFNSFKIEGLTEGKLMAMARALQNQQDTKTITVVGQEVLQSICLALNMAKIDTQIKNALS
jgi:hypothetical protein